MNKTFHHPEHRLGILGGGQLGRMLIQKALDLDIRTKVLDPSPDAPCAPVATEFVVGDFKDYDTVMEFGRTVDLLTIEIENVNARALRALEKEGITVHPQPWIVEMVQDKGTQKQFYEAHGIPTADFSLIEDKKELQEYDEHLPFVQKLRVGGYDGRGVKLHDTPVSLDEGLDGPSVLEDKVRIDKEIAVLVARNPSDEIQVHDPVEMDFDPEANLVRHLSCPAMIGEEVEEEIYGIAEKLADTMGINGIMAIEFFVTKTGEVLVNEIAPRPHNSGHHTIEADVVSQYEQQLRAIFDLPLAPPDNLRPAVMVNLLGADEGEGIPEYEGLEACTDINGAKFHIYGKTKSKPKRKMGHVTVIDKELKEARKKADLIREKIKVRPAKEKAKAKSS